MKENNNDGLSSSALVSALAFSRKKYYQWGARKFNLIFGGTFAISAIGATLMDIFLSNGVIVNYTRAFLVLIMTTCLSLMLYTLVDVAVRIRKQEDPDYNTLRETTALSHRRMIMFIVLAISGVGLLVTSANSSIQYSIVVSILLSSALMAIVFARSTEIERQRVILGIADPRERAYDARMKQIQEQQAIRQKAKAIKQAERKKKRNKYLDLANK